MTTEPISIDGLSSGDETFDVALQLPDDVTLADGGASAVTVTATIGPSVSSRTFVVGVVRGRRRQCLSAAVDQLSITLSGPGGALGTVGRRPDADPRRERAGTRTHDLEASLGALPEGRAARHQPRHRIGDYPGSGVADPDPRAVDGGTLRNGRHPRSGGVGNHRGPGARARPSGRASIRPRRREHHPRPRHAAVGRDADGRPRCRDHVRGTDVLDLGIVTTPCLVHASGRGRRTGDHGLRIPQSGSGQRAEGHRRRTQDRRRRPEADLDRLIDDPSDDSHAANAGLGRDPRPTGAVEAYERHLLEIAGDAFAGLRIGIDCANGSASDIAPELFRSLGRGDRAVRRPERDEHQ